MALPLSLEEEKRYTEIIDDILANADLATISRKDVIRALEEKIGKDTSHQKEAVKSLIISRFDGATTTARPSKRSADEQAVEDGTPESGDEDDAEDAQPKKKKQKRSPSLDADAKLAARLQAQEDSRARSRSTRGGGTRAAKVTKKKPSATRKKSAAKVRSEDDSEIEGDAEAPKKRGGGFQKPFKLSPPLSVICDGEEQMSRPQVVKKVWDYIKNNSLQDPSDRRQIMCDSQLQLLFGEKTNAFTMNKLLSKHLYPIDE